jgi:hypothetical protein
MKSEYQGDVSIGKIGRRVHPSKPELEEYLSGDMAEGSGLNRGASALVRCLPGRGTGDRGQ